MEEIRNTLPILVVKLKGKRPLGRPRRKWFQDKNWWRVLLEKIVNLQIP